MCLLATNWQQCRFKIRGIGSFLLSALNFFKSLSKQATKGLTIAASTIAVVELVKHEYAAGISAAISWLILVITYQKIFK